MCIAYYCALTMGPNQLQNRICNSRLFHMEPFNNYVDKMRVGGGQKMSVFVHAQGIKTVHAGGGQKIAKFCPRSCWMPYYSVKIWLGNCPLYPPTMSIESPGNLIIVILFTCCVNFIWTILSILIQVNPDFCRMSRPESQTIQMFLGNRFSDYTNKNSHNCRNYE